MEMATECYSFCTVSLFVCFLCDRNGGWTKWAIFRHQKLVYSKKEELLQQMLMEIT